MGRGQTQWWRVVLAVLAIPVGLVGAGWLGDLTRSALPGMALWLCMGLAFSLWWRARLALLFVLPLTFGFVAGDVAGESALDPAFYSAATQVGPVLFLALGLEQRSLQAEVKGRLETFLFMLLLGYLAVALVSAMHATAVCDSSVSAGCSDVFFRHHLLGVTDFGITAASLTAGGLAAGLTGAVGLSVLGVWEAGKGGPEKA